MPLYDMYWLNCFQKRSQACTNFVRQRRSPVQSGPRPSTSSASPSPRRFLLPRPLSTPTFGATENARQENAAQGKMQSWKNAKLENAGMENAA